MQKDSVFKAKTVVLSVKKVSNFFGPSLTKTKIIFWTICKKNGMGTCFFISNPKNCNILNGGSWRLKLFFHIWSCLICSIICLSDCTVVTVWPRHNPATKYQFRQRYDNSWVIIRWPKRSFVWFCTSKPQTMCAGLDEWTAIFSVQPFSMRWFGTIRDCTTCFLVKLYCQFLCPAHIIWVYSNSKRFHGENKVPTS